MICSENTMLEVQSYDNVSQESDTDSWSHTDVSIDPPKITIPQSAPEMSQLKLITMTVNANIRFSLNLDVIARHTQLDNRILGISYRNIIRGVRNKKGKCKVTTSDSTSQGEPNNNLFFKSGSTSGRFKNQCTFIIDVGDKTINTKVFNNGKMVSVGCKKPEHAMIAANILREVFLGMDGLVIYTIPNSITSNNVKKFFKDDLRKKFGDLIQLLACELDLDINLEPFSTAIPADDAYKMFQEELVQNSSYCTDIMYIYTIISILKCYYEEDQLLDRYNEPEFRYLLTMIIDHTDHEVGEISCVFPSYLNNRTIIPFDNKTVQIALINESTNCGYFINRTELVSLLLKDPNVIKCTYDKNRYPGVITVYRTPTKDVKIILFNTGKINITATRTHEQVGQAYKFITEFCNENFDRLLLKSEYYNKIKEYEDKLPSQFHVGIIDDQQYYLLKKTSITSNPRNVRYLKLKSLLNEYR